MFLKGFAIGTLLCAALLALASCGKTEPFGSAPAVQAPVAVAPAVDPKPAAVSSVAATSASTDASPTATSTPPAPVAVKAKPKSKHVWSAERAAFKVAYGNAARANQLLDEKRFRTGPSVV